MDTNGNTQVARDADIYGADAPVDTQRAFWNGWNAIFLGSHRNEISQRQATEIEGWLAGLGRRDLDLIDVGCGIGWMCERLQRFGRVTGTDLSDHVLAQVRPRLPAVRLVAGDFMKLDFPAGGYDVVVALEVLSHVADQPAFMARVASLLRPGGHLMLATQNRPVLERCEDVAPRAPGQIRHWVDRHQLTALMQPHFELRQLKSICPHGHRGALRIANSVKLNAALGALVGRARVERIKEGLWLGHTLMAWGRRR